MIRANNEPFNVQLNLSVNSSSVYFFFTHYVSTLGLFSYSKHKILLVRYHKLLRTRLNVIKSVIWADMELYLHIFSSSSHKYTPNQPINTVFSGFGTLNNIENESLYIKNSDQNHKSLSSNSLGQKMSQKRGRGTSLYFLSSYQAFL